VCKTWAPRGQTPLLRHRTRRDKVSVISGVSVSPRRHHLGLYYDFYAHNISQHEVYTFLRQLLRHLRGDVLVLLDNARIHTATRLRALCRRQRRLHLEYFPGYAPELNPDEGVWIHAKRALANGRPDTLAELIPDVLRALERVRGSHRLLRSCILQSDLPFRLP